jgi:hypothetical protein
MKKLILLLGLLMPALSHAQTYSIDWYKVSGGGGVSSGGGYSVSGTIGQHDAGSAMIGGSYSVTGGFWGLISVVQKAGLPLLTIGHARNTVIISWPNTATCALQQNSNVAQSAGWTACGSTVCTNNGTCSITISPPAGNVFFRLGQ